MKQRGEVARAVVGRENKRMQRRHLTGVECRQSATAGYKAMWSPTEGLPPLEYFEAAFPGLKDQAKKKEFIAKVDEWLALYRRFWEGSFDKMDILLKDLTRTKNGNKN